MELKELFNGVMVDTLGFTAEEVASLYDEAGNPKEDAKDTILNKRSQFEAKRKDEVKAKIQQAKDSGLRQKGEEWEKRLSKGLGIDFGDAQGDDVVELIRTRMEAKGEESKGVDPKDEQAVKNSPFYRKMEMEYAKKHAEIVKENEAKLAGVQSEFQRKETLRTVREDAMAMLTELNVNLPKDPKVKANQLKLLDLYLNDHTFEKDGDEWVVKDKEGNIIETPQGHSVKYKEFLKAGIADNFEFAASTTKTTAGDITKGSKPSGGSSVLKKPANPEEYAAKMQEIRLGTSDRVERQRLLTELQNVYEQA